MSFLIDEELLLNCLKSANPDSKITIKNYQDGQYVVEPNTNYSSEIVRVGVEYECSGQCVEEFLVFKVPSLSPHYEFLNKLGFYNKETYMYDAVLPKMRKMLNLEVIPKHYYSTVTHVLALEDLTVQGYYFINRAALDFQHCAQTFEGLAKFHASSVKLHQQDPDILVPASHEALYTSDVISKSMRACYPVLIEALQREKISSHVLTNFASYEEKINESSICTLGQRSYDFNVLNHGDLKTNNILFKNDDLGTPVSVKFIDYQTCRWNSPILDLIFFNMATMDFAVYEKFYEALLDRYLVVLNKTLSELGCQCQYTLEDCTADMKGSKLFQLFTLVWIGFLDLREAIPGFDYHKDIQLQEDEVEKILENEMFQHRFLNWFKYFEKQGFFK